MKKIIQKQLFVLFMLLASVMYSQSYEIRIVENDIGYLEVQMRETTGGTNLPSNTNGDLIGDITFAIRWSSSLGTDLAFLCSTNDYNIYDPSGVVHTDVSGWHYRYYNANNTPFVVPTDWVQNQWETLATFYAVGGSGTGTFEVAPQYFGISSLNWAIAYDGTIPYEQYLPLINGSATGYPYPTIVYDYVWVGGNVTPPFYDASSWANPTNWVDQCGGTVSLAPANTNNVFVPGGLTYYPNNIYTPAAGFAGTGLALNVRIASGGSVTIGNTSHQDQLTFSGNLNVYGTITMAPDGWVTVNGDTYLDAAECLVVEATTDGVGSFIDNGTITYGTSGSAKVQTFLHNGATTGSFWIHLVGPTVDITGSPGVLLGDFDLAALQTFAYQWDETVPSTSGWTNVYNPTTPILTATGLALSTNDATDHTLEMTGDLLTGAVSTPLTYSNNYLELISNPYPSAIDFDQFATDNETSDILNEYWIWDPAGTGGAGNWITRAGGTGGQQHIQVGQGFFVETKSGTTSADFNNAQRAHSTDAFRDVQVNELHVTVEGGSMGYKDNAWIRFRENEEVTNGYDQNFDGEKWASYYDDATSIWTTTEDSTAVQVNQLPLEQLQRSATSVPMSFICGYAGEYTLNFEGIDSFDNETDIWLEDKKTGGDWISLNDNPGYTFTASPNDDQNRFIIHFFGLTGVDQNLSLASVQIYSYGNYAYVVNNSDERIKEVFVYNLSGERVIERRVPDQRVNKLRVPDQLGYYIVKVITDKNIYTGKILISSY